MKELKDIIYWILGYRIDHYGMCPDCVEKNKKQITFCTHKGIYYKNIFFN